MCVYCKAASVVLDELWNDDNFRSFIYDYGHELADLGPLTHMIFAPAYCQFKSSLRGGELDMLEAQVTQDLLGPFYNRPSFREMWEAWDQATRDAFLSEQSEMKLAEMLVMVFQPQLDAAFREAFLGYIDRA
jgi:hypothetical protein